MVESIFVILILIAFAAIVYIHIRNHFVYKFKCSLNILCYNICSEHTDTINKYDNVSDFIKEHEKIENMWSSIADISYDRMVFSFKPLKPKYWLNKEQLEFINNSKI